MVVFDGVGGSISGFTITGGTGGDGYGIYCKSGANPTITNNVIRGNSPYGIYCVSSSPTITNNTITGNSQHGIYFLSSSFPNHHQQCNNRKYPVWHRQRRGLPNH